MTDGRVQDVWLGLDDPWRPWVKQALFSSLTVRPIADPDEPPPWLGQDLSWLGFALGFAQGAGGSAYRDRTTVEHSSVAVLVDLPGHTAIEMGLALGHAGWRPVLAINATSSAREVIDMAPVLRSLEKGARFSSSFPSTAEAAPVFLLDARREGGAGLLGPGRFDNRWTVFASDLPSARHLQGAGIDRVVIVQAGATVKEDIQAIAWAYQRAGLDVRVANTKDRTVAGAPGEPEGWLGFMLGQLQRRFALNRRWDGSYGHRIPIPPEPSHG